MPDDQGAQPSSAQTDDYRGAQQLQKLKEELQRRIIGLRRMSNVFLAFAIFVLVAGAAVLIFYANYIARLTLSPPETAAAQYDKAMVAQKRLGEQHEALNRQEKEIINEAEVVGPRNEAIRQINAEMTTAEDDVLQHCDKHTLSENKSVDYDFFKVTPSPYSNEYEFVLSSGRTVSFENLNSANDCNKHFSEYQTKVRQYFEHINKINSETFKSLNINRHNKSEQLQPIVNNSHK
jgi:hypothetical protein